MQKIQNDKLEKKKNALKGLNVQEKEEIEKKM